MTIFSVQRFLEDYFNQRRLADVDQYAIRAANVFEKVGPRVGEKTLARELGRIRTVFFRRNGGLERKAFEARLALVLHRRFQKKKTDLRFKNFEHGLATVRGRFRGNRRSIASLLSEFKKAVEARAIDVFWDSRKNRRLRHRPEKLAQGLLAVFARGVVRDKGLVLRELASGVGFVDVGISFGGVVHIIELKILKGQLTGTNQLATYMGTENRNVGWLVLIDTRRDPRNEIPRQISTQAGKISVLLVNVNPPAPFTR